VLFNVPLKNPSLACIMRRYTNYIVYTLSSKSGCSYNNQQYEEFSSFASTDGCNSCRCERGKVTCTRRRCGKVIPGFMFLCYASDQTTEALITYQKKQTKRSSKSNSSVRSPGGGQIAHLTEHLTGGSVVRGSNFGLVHCIFGLLVTVWCRDNPGLEVKILSGTNKNWVNVFGANQMKKGGV
jgi:hypothetical protein